MSTITKEFTKEQLIEQAKKNIEVLRGAVEKIPGSSDAAVIHLKLAEITLASLEAEAMALRDERSGSGGISKKPGFNDLPHGTPLYAAPPAPVSVPDDNAITQHFDTIALEVAREIMCDVNRRHEFLGGEVQLLSRIQCRIDDACRAAMLQGADGNSLVIPDGWVMVPVEPTEHMIFEGFESEPDEFFSDAEVWEAYDAMSGCQQAAHRAKLCWAAMLAAAPKPEA